MVKTPSCDKPAAQHSAVLVRHIKKKSFIDYEGLNAPLDKSKILACRSMWKDLRDSLDPNLNFKDSVLQKALKTVYEEVGSSWPKPLLQGDVADWAKTMSERIRAQARAIKQALSLHPLTCRAK